MKPDLLIAHSEDRDPALRLPHAYPFHLLDRAVVLAPGRWAVGMKNLTRDDPLVDAEGSARARSACGGDGPDGRFGGV